MNVYEIVTERIIQLVKEKGHLPWQRPWKAGEAFPANLERPDKPYQGINFWILMSQGYKSPYWITAKQAKRLGGRVNSEDWKKSTLVVFWKMFDEKNTDGSIKKRTPVLRYYYVYNVEQTTGLEKHIPNTEQTAPENFNPIEECERILSEMPMSMEMVRYGFNHACYKPFFDQIEMPSKESFNGIEEFYSTLFHELSHSTGHETRCDRKDAFGAGFGSEKYSKEELVAEISTCFLCHKTGIDNKTINNSAAYIGSWLKRLQDDPRMIVFAASAAQKATDYILNKKP
jgi:antirestriction protein ArdC